MAFTKMEGTTVNAKDKVAYSALQNIQSSMVRGNAAWRESLNVTVEKAIVAGGVFAHTLASGQKDTDGGAINSEWVPVQTKALSGQDSLLSIVQMPAGVPVGTLAIGEAGATNAALLAAAVLALSDAKLAQRLEMFRLEQTGQVAPYPRKDG